MIKITDKYLTSDKSDIDHNKNNYTKTILLWEFVTAANGVVVPPLLCGMGSDLT